MQCIYYQLWLWNKITGTIVGHILRLHVGDIQVVLIIMIGMFWMASQSQMCLTSDWNLGSNNIGQANATQGNILAY